MLTLRFDSKAGEDVQIGPVPYFRIEGSELFAGGDDEPVATHANGSWRVGERFFTVLTTDAPTRVRFEDDGEHCAGSHGPFERVHLVDGAIWHGSSFDGLLARLDEEDRSWYVYSEQVHCPQVVFEPAAA